VTISPGRALCVRHRAHERLGQRNEPHEDDDSGDRNDIDRPHERMQQDCENRNDY
jgi:hypothetical protein